MANEIEARDADRVRLMVRVRKALIAEHGLTPIFAAAIAAKVDAMDADLRTAFEDWIDSGAVPTLVVEGLSIEALATCYRMTTVVAFLMLDRLRRDPKRAFAALQKRSEPAAFVVPRRRAATEPTGARHLRAVQGTGGTS